MVDLAIKKLVTYGMNTGLIKEQDQVYITNTLLESLKINEYNEPQLINEKINLSDTLDELVDYAVKEGILTENTITYRDQLDTMLMSKLTPLPSECTRTFYNLYKESPSKATDWYYQFSQDTNYIRRNRIAKDVKWSVQTEYGSLDITINLSKPEKDPKEIAAARKAPSLNYPKCLLCKENEGYPGHIGHPPRQNHRIIPITINNSAWFMQYSPYIYYNEHCIVFNSHHTPMKIDRSCFQKLLDFIEQFPHYFVGSNADLPIVGGSILSHDHFQGGHYTFAMEKAPIETPISFKNFDDVTAGILKWPMSVIRLKGKNIHQLVDLADRILNTWKNYTDTSAYIFAKTEEGPHNTITPIARMRGNEYELDLVLRNNITTEQHPLGVFHPHKELHHIKKENIGLIEVMGLAVLPARLKEELAILEDTLLNNPHDLRSDERIAKHADWAERLLQKYNLTEENVMGIIQQEIGLIFTKVLEHAGVFKRTPEGQKAFKKFLTTI